MVLTLFSFHISNYRKPNCQLPKWNANYRFPAQIRLILSPALDDISCRFKNFPSQPCEAENFVSGSNLRANWSAFSQINLPSIGILNARALINQVYTAVSTSSYNRFAVMSNEIQTNIKPSLKFKRNELHCIYSRLTLNRFKLFRVLFWVLIRSLLERIRCTCDFEILCSCANLRCVQLFVSLSLISANFCWKLSSLFLCCLFNFLQKLF